MTLLALILAASLAPQWPDRTAWTNTGPRLYEAISPASDTGFTRLKVRCTGSDLEALIQFPDALWGPPDRRPIPLSDVSATWDDGTVSRYPLASRGNGGYFWTIALGSDTRRFVSGLRAHNSVSLRIRDREGSVKVHAIPLNGSARAIAGIGRCL